MDYYRKENGITILTVLDGVINQRIQQKIKNDSDYNKRFRSQLLEEINVKYKDNPYGLDVNMIPVRLKERNKQSAYGWYSDENNNIININTDNGMLLLQQRDLYTITKQRIMKRYAKSCTSRSVFMRIIAIVEEYKESIIKSDKDEQEYTASNDESGYTDDSSEGLDEYVYDSEDDII